MGSELGVSNPQMNSMKTVLRIMALMMIPLTAQFPAVSAIHLKYSNLDWIELEKDGPLMLSCNILIKPLANFFYLFFWLSFSGHLYILDYIQCVFHWPSGPFKASCITQSSRHPRHGGAQHTRATGEFLGKFQSRYSKLFAEKNRFRAVIASL